MVFERDDVRETKLEESEHEILMGYRNASAVQNNEWEEYELVASVGFTNEKTKNILIMFDLTWGPWTSDKQDQRLGVKVELDGVTVETVAYGMFMDDSAAANVDVDENAEQHLSRMLGRSGVTKGDHQVHIFARPGTQGGENWIDSTKGSVAVIVPN